MGRILGKSTKMRWLLIKTKHNLNKKIFLFVLVLLFLIVADCNGQAQEDVLESPSDGIKYRKTGRVINVHLYKKNDNYSVKSLDVVIGDFNYLPDYEIWKGKLYNGRVVSFRGNILGYFMLPHGLAIGICYDEIGEDGEMHGGCESLSEGELLVRMPYFPNGKYADIYDTEGNKVLTIDISEKATCNENDVCDRPVEDSRNCPQDCRGGESPVIHAGEQGGELTLPHQGELEISSEKSNWKKIVLIFLAILILITIAALTYYFWRKRKYYDQ